VGVTVGFGVGRGLRWLRLWTEGFSALAVMRGNGTDVGLGTGVQVGSEVGRITVVLSGVRSTVGVGVSACTDVLVPPASAAPNSRPITAARMKPAHLSLKITRSAAVADQTSAGRSASNDRIRASTSSITESGVEAPAVTPTRPASSNQSDRRSEGRST
jgi:hypothetical protein